MRGEYPVSVVAVERSVWLIAPAFAFVVGAVVLQPTETLAACAPATGSNITVTCSGATVNQGPGINTGYGDSTQNGLTLNIQSGASVTGTSIGIDVNNNNTINNLGTITTNGNGSIGDVFGINGDGALTVINSGTIGRADVVDNLFDLAGINEAASSLTSSGLSVTNNAGGVIQGSYGIIGIGVGTVVNSGLITAIGGGGSGIDFSGNTTSSVTVTNNASGTITGDAYGINASIATVINYGTISAPTSGGVAVNANSLTLTNYASGVITGDGGAISGSQTPTLTITNFGMILGGIDAGSGAISGNVVNVTNSGTISVATGSGDSAITMASGSIINNAGGIISGDFNAIATDGNTTVFNAGTISAAGGDAILFAFFGGNTLTIAPTSVITGNVVATGSDTFQLGGTGSGTFNLSLIGSQYTGFSIFNKIGTSTWTATGTLAQASPWTVESGTLLVNGNLSAASSLTVTGGTLGGIGTIGNTQIDSGGTLAPGSGGPAGTLIVNGSLAFNSSSSFYAVQIAPGAGNNSKTAVIGSANLSGNGTVVVTPQFGTYNSTVYQILTTTTGHTGTFAGLTVNGGFAGNISLDYTTNPGDVDLDVAGTVIFATPAGANQNQQNVLNGINQALIAGVTLPPGFQNLGNLSSQALLSALNQLSGEAATDGEKGAFQLMTDFLALMLDMSADGRGGFGGASGFAAEQDTSFPPDIALAYAAILKAPPKPAAFDQRWSVWGSGFGGYNKTDGDPVTGSNTVTARDYGFAAGMDYRVTPNTILGFALAGGGTNWGLAQGLGGGRSDAFEAGVYGTTHMGPAYVSAALAFANHWMTTNRVALGDQLTARFDGQSYGGRIEAGYRYGMPTTGALFGVTPYAALQAQSFHTPRYSETDLTAGGFGLSYNAMSATDTRSELGARFDDLTTFNGMPLILRARAAWAHDWVSNPALGAVFQALPGSSFTVNGAAPPQNSALASAGAELRLTANWSAMAKFDGEFASGAQTYAGTGTLRYAW